MMHHGCVFHIKFYSMIICLSISCVFLNIYYIIVYLNPCVFIIGSNCLTVTVVNLKYRLNL